MMQNQNLIADTIVSCLMSSAKLCRLIYTFARACTAVSRAWEAYVAEYEVASFKNCYRHAPFVSPCLTLRYSNVQFLFNYM